MTFLPLPRLGSLILNVVVQFYRSKFERFDAKNIDKAEFELIDVGTGAVDQMPKVSESGTFGCQHQIHASVAQVAKGRQSVRTKITPGRRDKEGNGYLTVSMEMVHRRCEMKLFQGKHERF